MNPFDGPTAMRFAVALGLGFLVGLERESIRADHQGKLSFGGVRTFPILSLFGFACAWLHTLGATLVLPAGLAAVASLAVLSYIQKAKLGRLGVTSEISALLTFAVGALSLLADVRVAMALGVVNTFLLSEKSTLESYVERLDHSEFLAILKFLLVTLIIYPVLPDESYGRFALNPSHVWRVVMLVSTIGFVGYFLTHKFDSRMGLWMSGLLGGVVSSTATTIAMGRLAAANPEQARVALQSAMLAGSVMYVRILVLVGLLNPALVVGLAWKAVALAGAGVLLAWTATWRESRTDAPVPAGHPPAVQNPFEVKPALVFAALFVGISVLTTLARTRFGPAGLLALAGITGVTDVDPFILSLAPNAEVARSLAVQAMLVAVFSNTVMKGFYFAAMVPGARKATAARYAVWAVLHVPLILAA